MKRKWLEYGLLLVGGLMWIGGSASVQAATVQLVALKAAEGEDRLIVELDKPAAYRLYELEAPQRIIIQLDHARLAKTAQPIGKGRIVQHVSLEEQQDAVRIGLSLDGKAEYSMDEQGARLTVRVFHSGTGPEPTPRAVLKDIAVRDHEGVTEVFLRGDHMDVNSNAYFVNDGRTLIVDFWGAESKLAKEHFSYSSRYLRGITVGSAENRLRLVLDLSAGQGISHQIESSPSQWVLRLGGTHQVVKARQRVRSIDFVPAGQTAQIVIRTEQPNPVVNVSQKKGMVVVDLAQAALSDALERTLDVSSFPGPVRQIDSYRKGDDVRIVARLRDKVRLTSFQSGNVLTLNLVPVDMGKGQATAGSLKYHGEKVSFDFKDIDIRNALKLIAEMSDMNIIMGEDVQGKLTMRLIDVPWDQALDLILAAKGLGKEQQGNVLRIAPLAVLEQERAARIKARTSVQELEPLVTEFIHLGYASVSDIKALIESAAQKQGQQGGNEQAGQQGAS
ncbi:MAG: type IV pilus secretin family protein, partial [Zetaproteobacteria bacterium]